MSRASGSVRVIARVMLGLQSGFELRLGLRLLIISSVAMVLGGCAMLWYGVGMVCHDVPYCAVMCHSAQRV